MQTSTGQEMMMKYSSVFMVLAATTAACSLQTSAKPVTVKCPAAAERAMVLPKGAALLKKPGFARAILWQAGIANGSPADPVKAGFEFALAAEEQDDIVLRKDGTSVYHYQVAPAPTDAPAIWERYVLACYYGRDAKDASALSSTSALLLLPLPYKVKADCNVTVGKPGPGNKLSPVVSAVCAIR